MSHRRSGRITDLRRYEPLALVGGIWLIAKLLRYAFPVLFPTFRASLDVPNAWLGGAYTGMMLLYAAVQFPSGALADTLDDVEVVALGAVIAGIGGLVFFLPTTFPLLVVGMLLVGLGTGVHKTVSVGLLARLYPGRTGRALGAFDTLGTVGGVIAPVAVVSALSTTGWPPLFVGIGLVAIAFAVTLSMRVPHQEPSAGGYSAAIGDLELRSYLGPFRERRFQLFIAVTLCFAFAYNGVVAFLPLFLVEAGTTETSASILYSALFAVSVVQVVTGDLSDRVGRLTLSVGVLAVAAVALGGLVVVSGGGVLFLGGAVVLFGLGSHGFRPLRGAYLATEFPDEVAGGGLGLARTMLMGVGAIAPSVVGVIADAAGFRVAFVMLAVAMGLAAVLAVITALVDR